MRPTPRVRCEACDQAWYGATAAHGLHVLGHCPRCDGPLAFLERDADRCSLDTPVARLAGIAPAAVMGTPTSWAR